MVVDVAIGYNLTEPRTRHKAKLDVIRFPDGCVALGCALHSVFSRARVAGHSTAPEQSDDAQAVTEVLTPGSARVRPQAPTPPSVCHRSARLKYLPTKTHALHRFACYLTDEDKPLSP
jgi:hypothetical protein